MRPAGEPYELVFAGDLDVYRYRELREALSSVPPSARRILVDLRQTTTVDSTALSELLIAKRRWDREGRKTAVLVSNRHVFRLMSIANVLDKLKVFESAEKAGWYLAVGDP